MNRNGRKYNQYKGLREYLDVVTSNNKINQLVEATSSSEFFNNEIEVFDNSITIDESWVNKIEEYLTYISNAIQEGRRFILNTGETVDIEKIKKVTKDSIVDLAKHSDKIRNFDFEKATVEPKKLLVIEKNDDYGLYENRFLVFLIFYIKSFVSIRYEKIKDAQSSLIIKSNFSNDAFIYKDNIKYNFVIEDKRFNEFKIEETDINKNIFERIENIEGIINQFLKSDLISLVRKLPPIQEPIIKNNVLKNDPNFVKCYELYEFLKNYNEDGFIIENKNVKTNKLSKDFVHFFKYIPIMMTFLSYSEVKELFPLLNEEYEKEKMEKNEIFLNKIKEATSLDELNLKDVLFFLKNIYISIEEKDNEIKKLTSEKEEALKNLTIKFEDEKQKIYAEYILKEKENNKIIQRISEEKNNLNEKIKELNEEIDKTRHLLNSVSKSYLNNSENLNEQQFTDLEKDYEFFTNYFINEWKKIKKDLKKKKKEEIKKLLKRKEKLNG